jgi:hypothetical protein
MNESNQPGGLGCPPGASPDGARVNAGNVDAEDRARDVYRLLRLGSARLALAKAMCVPFQPTVSSVRGYFASTTQTQVLNVGVDPQMQFTQDTLIEGVDYTIVNQSLTANSNIAQPWSDYYYGLQSGLECTLQVGKAPWYGVAPILTPLSTFLRAVKADTTWPNGWILGKSQQVTMSFNASVALPYAPLLVVVSFLGKIPTTDKFLDGNMTQREALDQLEEYGYSVKEYRDYLCR